MELLSESQYFSTRNERMPLSASSNSTARPSERREKLYQAANQQRQKARRDETATAISSLVEDRIAGPAPKAGRRFRELIAKSQISPAARRTLARKFTLAELLEILLDASEGVIPS